MKDKIILYDGGCNLCDRTVGFIPKHDRSHQFNLIPIQTDEGQVILAANKLNPAETDSVIYLENNIAYIKSEAFFRIANQIGGILNLLIVFRFLPRKLTDWVYDGIAKNRYNCLPVDRQTINLLSE